MFNTVSKKPIINLVALSLCAGLAAPALAQQPEAIECRCDTAPGTQPIRPGRGPDLDYGRAFAEGSPLVFSASTVEADSLNIFYSHNFFWSTVPRGSNPAFWFKYSPLERLQIDAMTTLRSPFEVEIGLAWQILDESKGDLLSLTPRLAYNSRGNLVGGEIAASRFIFPELWQVGADLRLLSTAEPDGFNRPVAALGFNTMIRVWKHWHLYGDVVVPFDGEILQQRSVLWSAGIKKRIPHTPHILTLYVGNAQEQSLAGRTISTSNKLGDVFRIGFVFSIAIDEVSHMPEKLF
ncbi:MAG: hypothetical protein CVV27_04485 [Candidatus Melainabacteria bacterium HGW-Melainabacteria-1]|nr:MAG: hypothetical protein CVV27_04485 [Candidatus Melainabacteria bacterium HGW-Melainabacteria-1]